MANTKIKTLANCKPSEFMKQTNRIKRQVEQWLTDTDIMNIRKKLPTIPEGATEDERKTLLKEQSMKNLSEILDSALEEHTDETLAILALCCFVPVEKADTKSIDFYMTAISDMMESDAVARFFTLLVRLGQKTGK
jgi:hypothetical protein